MLFALLPSFALASGKVKTYVVIENANGGTKSAQDLFTRIDYPGGSQTQSGVPIYEVFADSYTLVALPPAGYRAELGDDCSSTLIGGEEKTCSISWYDGAPIVLDPPPVQNNTPEPVIAPVSSGGSSSSVKEETVPAPNPFPMAVEITSVSNPEIKTNSGTTTTIIIIKEVPVLIDNSVQKDIQEIKASQEKTSSALSNILEKINWLLKTLSVMFNIR